MLPSAQKSYRLKFERRAADLYSNAIAEGIELQTVTESKSDEEEEEKMITIDISDLERNINEDKKTNNPHDSLNKLLFSPNSSLRLKQQNTLQIKEYFDNREKDEYDAFSAGYINFYKLHVLLRSIPQKKPNSQYTFMKTLDREWLKYQKFAQKTAVKILKRKVSKHAMIQILKFNQFVWINQQNLTHLILKHDAISPENKRLQSIWDWKLKYAPQNILFPLIKQISNLYDSERCENRQPQLNQINSKLFERTNIKYWIRHSDIFQVIGIIIQHLPIYVYETNSKNKKNAAAQVQSHSVYQKISSVYFDNDDFKCYHERIAKEQGARSIRVRWYGNGPKPTATVYIERKRHQCNESSEKARFRIKKKHILSFINDFKNDGHKSGNFALQKEVFEMIKRFDLKPKTRTVYQRIAFQFAHNNEIRVSLDLNLKFVKEKAGLLQNSQWYTRFGDIYDADVAAYSLCVLEIKLAQQYAKNPPEWIQALMDSELLMDCHKFSKYGESVNQFYQNKVHIIPKWRLLDSDNESPEPDSNGHVEIVQKRQKKDENVHECADQQHEEPDNFNCDCFSLMKEMLKQNKKNEFEKSKAVNPKVYFSNERTFLGWFQAAVFIGGSGLTIHAIHREDVAGYLMISVAGLVLLWAVYIYYKRNFRLLRGSTEGLHDFYGPAMLVSIIIFVFAYSLLNGMGAP